MENAKGEGACEQPGSCEKMPEGEKAAGGVAPPPAMFWSCGVAWWEELGAVLLGVGYCCVP